MYRIETNPDFWKHLSSLFNNVRDTISCVLKSDMAEFLCKIAEHLLKSPQYFLPFLAFYGAARALRVYKCNALTQSHMKAVQSIVDKIDWYREYGFEGNIYPHEFERFLFKLENDIRLTLRDTSEIEWPDGPNLFRYGTDFDDGVEAIRLSLEIKTRNKKYLTARIKRESQAALSDLIVHLDRYNAAIQQVYMLSPRIFRKYRIWMFTDEFIKSQWN